ncbi:MAG TPA: hypothetical protein DHU55_12515 [Blastocatellia bacterium]|nr:hypothetical protein [Blastocatellia bacterium]
MIDLPKRLLTRGAFAPAVLVFIPSSESHASTDLIRPPGLSRTQVEDPLRLGHTLLFKALMFLFPTYLIGE